MFSAKAIEGIREGTRTGEPVRGPFDVQILPLTACNQACVFCPLYTVPEEIKRVHAPRFIDSGKKMEWNIFERIVNGLMELGEVERVHFTGGEPLLHPRIADMTAAFKTAFPHSTVAIVTNGVLLVDRFDELAAGGVDRISISINAADERTYLRLSPSNRAQDFRKLIEGLKRVGNRKREIRGKRRHSVPEIALTCVLTRYNYGQVAELFEIATIANADSLTFIPIVPFEFEGTSRNTSFAVTKDQFEKFLDDIRKFAPQAEEKGLWLGYGGNEADGGILKLKPSDIPNPCYAGYSFIVFWPDGTIRPCCNCEMVMGDIFRQNLAEIWHSTQYREFRSKARSGDFPSEMRCSCNECGYLYENRFFRTSVKSEKIENNHL